MSLSYSTRTLARISKAAKSSKITKALYRKQWRRMLNKRLFAHSISVKGKPKKRPGSPHIDLCTETMALYTDQLCTNLAERLSSPKSAASSITDILHHPLLFVPATELTYESEKTIMRARKPLKIMRTRKPLKVVRTLHLQRRTLTGKISKEWPATKNSPRLGLRNQGAVCYRRAVMQALLNIPIFVNWAASVARSHSEPGKALRCPTGGCTVCAFNRISDAIRTNSPVALGISTRLFDNAVRAWHGRGLVAREDWMRNEHIHTDAREFFMALIGVLQADPMLNNPSPIVEGLFSLRLRQESVCPRCKYHQVSPSVDELTPLIQLNDEHNVPFKNPIAALFSTKISKMTCGSCGFTADRVCTKYIEAAPEVLILAINVFTIDRRGVGHKNTNARLDFPEILDLSRFASNGATQPLKDALNYRLSSVICHSGSVRGGHYVNYSVSPGSGIHMYDDSAVRKRSETELLGGEGRGNSRFTPYVLTYVNDGGAVSSTKGRKM